MSDSLQPHELQHASPSCPLPPPRVYSNSCPLSQWCHPTISSSVVPFSSCLQSFPASLSLQMSQFFTSGGQSIGVSASASVLPMNIQDWSPLGWTGWISLQSKGLSRVFFKTCSGIDKGQMGNLYLYPHLTEIKWGPSIFRSSLVAQLVKNPPVMQETPVWFLGQEDLLEKG